MESAIFGRVAFLPNLVFNPKPGEIHNLCKGPSINGGLIRAVSATGPGKAVGFLQSEIRAKVLPSNESEFDMGWKFFVVPRRTASPYLVILHKDPHLKRGYIIKVLIMVIPGMTIVRAIDIMGEVDIFGTTVVIICPQADAEDYCSKLRGSGLMTSIEPAIGWW